MDHIGASRGPFPMPPKCQMQRTAPNSTPLQKSGACQLWSSDAHAKNHLMYVDKCAVYDTADSANSYNGSVLDKSYTHVARIDMAEVDCNRGDDLQSSAP